MKKNSKRLIKQNLEQKRYLREKVINSITNGNDNRFNSWIDKKDLV